MQKESEARAIIGNRAFDREIALALTAWFAHHPATRATRLFTTSRKQMSCVFEPVRCCFGPESNHGKSTSGAINAAPGDGSDNNFCP